MQIWYNINGRKLENLLNDPSFPDHPNTTKELENMASPLNLGDNYGLRLVTYFMAPVTGTYYFYLAGDNQCALYLSTNDKEADKQRIIFFSKHMHTKKDEWDKFPEQKSTGISLYRGRVYYMEALLKESRGGDHISVGVTFPSETDIKLIDGKYLFIRRPVIVQKPAVLPRPVKPVLPLPEVKPSVSESSVGIQVTWQSLTQRMKQIDTGITTFVWAVDVKQNIFYLNGNNFEKVDATLMHVSAGESGIWGVSSAKNVYFREGVSLSKPQGTSWTLVDGGLVQIDSGPISVVCGVDELDHIYCRDGITNAVATGTRWKKISGTLKYISCGAYGYWGVDKNNDIFFAQEVYEKEARNTDWVKIAGSLVQLESGPAGEVWGVNANNELFSRVGVSQNSPSGLSWVKVGSRSFVSVTVGFNQLYAVDVGNTVFAGSVVRVKPTAIQPVGGPGSLPPKPIAIQPVGGPGSLPPKPDAIKPVGGPGSLPPQPIVIPTWKVIPFDSNVDKMRKIDSGITGAVWAINLRDHVYVLKPSGTWEYVPGNQKHITAGESGVWAIDVKAQVQVRHSISDENPTGSTWLPVSGKMTQIDSGPVGILCGIDLSSKIRCRTGLRLADNAKGSNWADINFKAAANYISCGAFGCWVIDSKLNVYFRKGQTESNPTGTAWVDVTGQKLTQLEAGPDGKVWGVTKTGGLFSRDGVTAINPTGTSWKKEKPRGYLHVTVGQTGVYAITEEGLVEHYPALSTEPTAQALPLLGGPGSLPPQPKLGITPVGEPGSLPPAKPGIAPVGGPGSLPPVKPAIQPVGGPGSLPPKPIVNDKTSEDKQTSSEHSANTEQRDNTKHGHHKAKGVKCADTYTKCRVYAAHGMCTDPDSASSMVEICPKSCRVC